MLRFDVRLLLPVSQPGAPLRLNALRTDLPLFAHRVHDLGDTVYFNSIQLETGNTPVRVEVSIHCGTAGCCSPLIWQSVQTLTGNNIALRTTNAAINGTFYASSSLTLETSNAAIVTRANLVNGAADEDGDALPTRLSLITRNGCVYSP